MIVEIQKYTKNLLFGNLFLLKSIKICDISTRKSDEDLFFFALHFGNEQIYRTKGVHANSKIFLGVRVEKSLRTTVLGENAQSQIGPILKTQLIESLVFNTTYSYLKAFENFRSVSEPSYQQ